MQKVDSLRNDLRRSEKNRRELETCLEDAILDATKEKKQRERVEEFCRQLQSEVRNKNSVDAEVKTSFAVSAEVSLLDLERVDVLYGEKLDQQQAIFNLELSSLKEQLKEAEENRKSFYHELLEKKEKLESNRMESVTDAEETISELKNKYEKEKICWQEEKKLLLSNIEHQSSNGRTPKVHHIQLETDYEELL